MADLDQLTVMVGPQDVIFNPAEAALCKQGYAVRRFRNPDAFRSDDRQLRDASVLYATGSTPVTRAMMEAAPRLRAIISPVTGTEAFDEAAATELGILVGHAPIPENYISMAEATIMLILACLYDLPGKAQALRRGMQSASENARMLQGKTLGLLGYGRIAGAMVERLLPWNLRFLATTPRPPSDAPAVEFVDLERLLRESDVLCVLATLNAQTRDLLDSRRLAMTRAGSSLVVVSRGGIVNERALFVLAKAGHFARIALDVFEEEPLPLDSPLRTLDNVILTPHAIGHSRETHERLPLAGVESIRRVLAGQPPLYVRNPEVLPRWHATWTTR